MSLMRKLSQKYGGIQFFAGDLSNKVVNTTIHVGANKLDNAYLDATALDRIYLGSNLLYSYATVYNITENLSNCTADSSNQTSIVEGATATLKYTADANYELPDSVTVANATSNWNAATGVLTISNPTGDVEITITAVRITYSITENLTNVNKSGIHPTFIAAGGTIALLYTAPDNYELPDNITVTGAEYSWKESTGTLTLTNPTGAVTITMAGVSLLKIITAGTYVVKDAPTVTSTHAQFAFTTNTVAGSAITVTSAGITYALAAPTGSTQVYTAATSAWTLPAYKTLVLAADVHVSEAFNTWWTTNVLPKLDTPTGLSITGNTLTFDEVANAEQYEVFAGSNSIGTYTPPPQQLISFTIDSVSYQAESGMTWAQWIASSYNTGGFVAGTDNYTQAVSYSNKTDWVTIGGTTQCKISETIIAGTAYVKNDGSSGGGYD